MRVTNKPQMMTMISFAGWNFFGGVSYIINTQGINILLNMFFGPVVNAARGLAIQVQSSIKNFAENVQNAINPQITKSYAADDFNRVYELINMSSKYSMILLYILAAPILVDTKTVLDIWLVDTPEHTIAFVRILLMTTFVTCLSTPFTICSLATGEIKAIQISTGIITILALPVSYLFLKFNSTPETVLIVVLVVEIICQVIRVLIVSKQTRYPLWKYICLIFKVAIALTIPTFFLLILMTIAQEGFVRLLLLILVSSIVTLLVTYFMLLNSLEQAEVKKMLEKKLKNIIKK